MAGIIGGSSAATKGLRRSHYHTVLRSLYLPRSSSNRAKLSIGDCSGQMRRYGSEDQRFVAFDRVQHIGGLLIRVLFQLLDKFESSIRWSHSCVTLEPTACSNRIAKRSCEFPMPVRCIGR